MADVKISALPASSVLTGAEEIPVVQSDSTVKMTVQQILDAVPVSDPVPDSTATDFDGLKSDHNALLASLRASGQMGS